MRRVLVASATGLLFGLGLAIGGMTQPDKVLNFLDVSGNWDPSLALVMGGALAVTLPGFAWIRRRQRGGQPAVPAAVAPRAKVDRRLVLGSALFGIGWGIAGYCPGPALANLAHGSGEALWFVGAMLAGSQLARLLDNGEPLPTPGRAP